MKKSPRSLVVFLLLLAACGGQSSSGSLPGQRGDSAPFAEILPAETLRFTGNEPFWGGQVTGTALTYATPDAPDGIVIAVSRFAGRGGLSWTGMYNGARFALAVTPGECSDGMSDRTYPFVATLQMAGEQRQGCAWTERKPFTGSANP